MTYRIKGDCYFCKKDVNHHTKGELKFHLVMNHGYIEKLKQVQRHLIKDKKIMKKYISQRELISVNGRVRYKI